MCFPRATSAYAKASKSSTDSKVCPITHAWRGLPSLGGHMHLPHRGTSGEQRTAPVRRALRSLGVGGSLMRRRVKQSGGNSAFAQNHRLRAGEIDNGRRFGFGQLPSIDNKVDIFYCSLLQNTSIRIWRELC